MKSKENNCEKENDPFWSKENQEHLKKALQDLKDGKFKEHEIIETDNE